MALKAYLVADEPGGTAILVDSGAPIEPLLRKVEEWGVTPTHVLRTHSHGDNVAHEDELGVRVALGPLEAGQGKAWVRFDDGSEAIAGSSRVERR